MQCGFPGASGMSSFALVQSAAQEQVSDASDSPGAPVPRVVTILMSGMQRLFAKSTCRSAFESVYCPSTRASIFYD